MRRLLDTNAYSAFKLGEPAVVDLVRGADAILMSPIVLGELEGGFRAGSRAERNLADLASFLARPSVEVLPLSRRTASLYGRLAATLRRRGRPIPTNDMWIAAHALESGADLISYDAHFGEIEGLALVRPSAPGRPPA